MKRPSIDINEYQYITINEFARRIGYGEARSRKIALSQELCKRGIAVRMNPEGSGGVRINWPKYVYYVETECPASPEYRVVRGGSKK